MTSSTIRRIPTLLLAGAMAAGASLTLGAPAADAASPYIDGTVTATRLVVRQAPTSHSDSWGSVKKGQRVVALCQVQGQSVGGTRAWYLLNGEGDAGRFVSARYVTPKRKVPACVGNKTTTATLTGDQWVRRAPSTDDAKVRVARKGTTVTLRCGFYKGTSGTNQWFQTSDGNWISKLNLKGVDIYTAPGMCNAPV